MTFNHRSRPKARGTIMERMWDISPSSAGIWAAFVKMIMQAQRGPLACNSPGTMHYHPKRSKLKRYRGPHHKRGYRKFRIAA